MHKHCPAQIYLKNMMILYFSTVKIALQLKSNPGQRCGGEDFIVTECFNFTNL